MSRTTRLPSWCRAIALVPLLFGALWQIGPADAATQPASPWCTSYGLLRTEGAFGISSFDVAADGKTFAMSNGRSVWRTDDGGCEWEKILADVLEGPNLPKWEKQAPAEIVSLAVTTSSVHALVLDTSSVRASNVRLMVWREESGTWSLPRLPPQPFAEQAEHLCDGRMVCRLTRARGEAGTIHVQIGTAPRHRVLWRSIDDGDTYTAVVEGVETRFNVTSIAPLDGDPMALVGIEACNEIVRRSALNADWVPVARPRSGSTSVLGVAYSGRVVVAALGEPGACGRSTVNAIIVSDDHGTEFELVPVELGGFEAIALDRSGETTVIVHGGGSVSFLEGPTLHKVIVPDALNVFDARMIESDIRYVALATAEGIFIADTATEASGLRGRTTKPVPCSKDLPTVPETGGSLNLVSDEVRMDVGLSERIPVEASVDDAALPVDVMMLFDTSGSMSPAIRSMSRSILGASKILSGAGYDSRVGLAQFSDININPYELLVPLAAPGCELVRALERVYPGGGAEAHLLALHQGVTGSGWPAAGVPAGQGGGFRDEVSRLVVMLTDEEIDESMPGIPSWDETVAAMREAEARHIGIRVLDATEIEQPGATDPVRADMDALGRATDSLAPAGGLDCNGDGLRDLAEGDPMTCVFGGPASAGGVSDAELGDLLVQIISASVIAEEARLVVESPDGIEADLSSSGVQVEAGASASIVDELTIRCGARAAGDVKVSLMFGSAELAAATVPVTCGVAVLAAPPAVPNIRPPLPLPPPPPPAIVSVGQTASSQAQAQSHATSGALAPSGQRQPVLAYARRNLRTEPGLMLAAGALSLTAAAATQRRRQAALAEQEQR